MALLLEDLQLLQQSGQTLRQCQALYLDTRDHGYWLRQFAKRPLRTPTGQHLDTLSKQLHE